MKRDEMSDEIKEYSECSSEEEILLPMCNILPANEIITKNYEPDQTPNIKYIPKEILKEKELQKSSYMFDQLKISNPEFEEYASLFSCQDFLGKYYSNQLNQMVYFKFNNKEYNQLKINEKKYRFFAGFFTEKEHFEDIAHQNYDNVMKSFPFLDFVDYNSNLLLSFGKNNRGSLLDPKFSSNYDSANLFAVIRVHCPFIFQKKHFEYDLILQNDMNSKGNNQWFNFLVLFPQEGTYKFNIVNFVIFILIQTKSHSLYEKGMRVACYSFTKQMQRGNHENHKNGSGWFRGGKNIKYFRNEIQREAQGYNDCYYTLSFEYTCKNHSETMAFAYTVPYSGIELEKYFNKMLYKKVMGHFKMEKIYVCNSISGSPVYGYAISHRKTKFDSFKFNSVNHSSSAEKLENSKSFNFSKNFEKRSLSPTFNEESTQLKSVILMARQHSGEVQSSYVLEGAVDFLMANTELDQIKKGYTFFIFPMINVDGVKYGHYRTNLCGVDLNRIWRLPRKEIHPEVYHLKKILWEINKTTPISLILDIHGHSKALNSFFYGNPSKKENFSYEDPKLFPYICSKRIKYISYKQSTFSIREEKKNSARVVLSEMFPKSLVYTFENSFYGYVTKKCKEETESNDFKDELVEYTPEIYRKVGRELMNTYLEYTRLSEKNSSIKTKWMKEMEGIYEEMEKEKTTNLNNEDNDGGSDSELENELIEVDYAFDQNLKPDVEETYISPRKLWKPKTSILAKTSFISRKSEKKKTMPLPRTICEENVRGTPSHNFRSFTTLKDFNKKAETVHPENKENFEDKSPLDFAKKPEYPQAVLSIFKIETQRSSLLRKKTSINSLSGYQENSRSSENVQRRLSPPPNLLTRSPNNFERELNKTTNFENKPKKSKELNVEDVMNKCSGMKTFLKAMGITIENRKP